MPQRADIITAGVLIAKSIMEDFNISQITVSESDIMEAYLVENLELRTDSSVYTNYKSPKVYYLR